MSVTTYTDALIRETLPVAQRPHHAVGRTVKKRHTARRPGSALLLAGLTGIALWGLADHADAAAVKATIKKDVRTVTGTPGADTIALRLKTGDPNTLNVDVGADGIADFTFDRKRFTAIRVDGAGGNDTSSPTA
jgi:hypothetical protein